jgi:long-chain acyl-CoA synthetase
VADVQREVSGPLFVPVPDDAHILQPMVRWAERAPGRPVVAYRSGDRFVDVSAQDFRDRVMALAAGLVASGVQPGDRVALMSRTRLEWVLLDCAIVAVGAATVPIYDTSSAEQVEWIVSDSGAVLVLVETAGMRDVYREAMPAGPEVLVIDGGALDTLVDRGAGIDGAVVAGRLAALSASDLATVIYTSGTTGRPKGCMLTHGNLTANVHQTLAAIGPMLRDDERSLLFLPLAHALTKAAYLAAMEHGVVVAFATDLAHLAEELTLARPTMLVGVPRIFEKVFNGAQRHARESHKGRIFDRATTIAIRWSQQTTAGRASVLTRAEHAVFDRLVYTKLRHAFGGELRLALSGGSALGERLTHFFNGIGVRIFEGYGLTETSPTLTVNSAAAWRPGSAGRPVTGTRIRIDVDGEILAAGPQVFSGYWRNEAATQEVFDDEHWFRTGDLGQLDDDGFLWITGRKKELIVTAAGKNVAPAPLEDRLRAHPLVSQAIVIGDGRPFIAALVTLDAETLETWARDRDLPFDAADLAGHVEVRKEIQVAVDSANRSVSRAESVREFAILDRDFSVESGELTPSLKVRRTVVEKMFASAIEEIYCP